MNDTQIVDSDSWLTARLSLLDKEKEFTRLRDELSQERRNMPSVEIAKPYRFTDNNGEYALSDLFGDKSQLIIYHFMYGKEWKEPCKSCSFWADNFNGIDVHLAHRDIAFMAISSASSEQIEALKKRMGWSFRWLSSDSSEFNQDFQASCSSEQIERNEMYYNYRNQPMMEDEMAGVSVFQKDEHGSVLHTYSSYSRGIDILNGAYNYMDLAPKGRDEGGGIMRWLRIRDQYDEDTVD